MNTATVFQPTSITKGQILAAEKIAFNRIPGMDKLRSATPDTIAALKNKYPDAAFTLMISKTCSPETWSRMRSTSGPTEPS